MNRRIDEITMLKGAGILFVITGHMMTIAGLPSTGIWASLSLPVMGGFFLLSGYTRRAKRIGILKQIFNRIGRILIPYYQYSVVILTVLAVIYLLMEKRSPAWYADGALGILFQLQSFHMADTVSSGFHPMFYCVLVGWFPFQMAVSEIIFIPLLHYLEGKKNVWKLVSAVVLLLIGALLYKLNLQGLNGQFFPSVCKIFVLPNIPGTAGLMMTGNYLASLSAFDPDSHTGIKRAAGLLGIPVMALFIITDDHIFDFPIGKWGAFGWVGYLLSPVFILALLMSFFVLFSLVKKITPVKKLLIHYGDHSLDYTMIHLFVAFLVAYIGGFWYEYLNEAVPKDDLRLNYLHFFILLICVLSVSYAAIRILSAVRAKRSGAGD